MLLEYIKLLVSWQVVALILGLMALHSFKGSISALLGRFIRGSGYGITLEAQPVQQNTSNSEDQPKNLTEKSDPEKWVADNPKLVIEEYQKLYNSHQWERAYNLIYGTQLDLLEYLASKGDVGESYLNLRPFHLECQRLLGNENTAFAAYLMYLDSFRFITFNEQTQVVKIEPFGIAFLDHLKATYPKVWRIIRAY
jgi:hypothetical protein